MLGWGLRRLQTLIILTYQREGMMARQRERGRRRPFAHSACLFSDAGALWWAKERTTTIATTP